MMKVKISIKIFGKIICFMFLMSAFLSFVINFFMPIKSYAGFSSVVYLDSDKSSIKKGDEIQINLNIKDSEVTAYNANLYFDDSKLEFLSETENSNVIENRIILIWYDEYGGTNPKKGNLDKLIFRAKEDGEDGIASFTINGDFYNENAELIKTDFEKFQISVVESNEQNNVINNMQNNIKDEIQSNIQSSIANATRNGMQNNITSNIYTDSNVEPVYLEKENTNLETLAIENIFLNPNFSNDITEYNIEVSNTIDKLNILAIPENENATVQILGNEDLEIGKNVIDIIVIAQDGVTERQYKINAHKRNREEEQEFIEEEKEKTEKLKNAYEITRTGHMEIERERVKTQDNLSGQHIEPSAKIIMYVLTLSIIFGCVFFYAERKKN